MLKVLYALAVILSVVSIVFSVCVVIGILRG
jgi:hypothetical protein